MGKFACLIETNMLEIHEFDIHDTMMVFLICISDSSVSFLEHVHFFYKHTKRDLFKEDIEMNMLCDILRFYQELGLTEQYKSLLKSFSESEYMMRYKDKRFVSNDEFILLSISCIGAREDAVDVIRNFIGLGFYDID